jgi:hypothetical protein
MNDSGYVRNQDTTKYKVVERSDGYSIEYIKRIPVTINGETEYYTEEIAHRDIRKLTYADFVYYNGYELFYYKRK